MQVLMQTVRLPVTPGLAGSLAALSAELEAPTERSLEALLLDSLPHAGLLDGLQALAGLGVLPVIALLTRRALSRPAGTTRRPGAGPEPADEAVLARGIGLIAAHRGLDRELTARVAASLMSGDSAVPQLVARTRLLIAMAREAGWESLPLVALPGADGPLPLLDFADPETVAGFLGPDTMRVGPHDPGAFAEALRQSRGLVFGLDWDEAVAGVFARLGAGIETATLAQADVLAHLPAATPGGPGMVDCELDTRGSGFNVEFSPAVISRFRYFGTAVPPARRLVTPNDYMFAVRRLDGALDVDPTTYPIDAQNRRARTHHF